MLVNPISFRLSVSIFWNSTWSLYNKGNYKYLFYSDLVFFEFFMFFFRKTFITKGLDYYVSHIRVYRGYNKFIINVFYHTSKAEIFFNEFKFEELGLNLKNSKNIFYKKSAVKKNKKINKKINKKVFINFLYLIEKKLLLILLNLSPNFWLFTKNLKDFNSKLEIKLSKILKKEFKFISNLKNLSVIKPILIKYFINVSKNYITFIFYNLTFIQEYQKEKNKNNKVNSFLKQSINNKIRAKQSKLLINLLNLKFKTNKKAYKLKKKKNIKEKRRNLFYHNKNSFFHILNLQKIITIFLKKNRNNTNLKKHKFNQFILNISNIQNVIQILSKAKNFCWNYSLLFDNNSLRVVKTASNTEANASRILKRKLQLKQKINLNFSFLRKNETKELDILKRLNKRNKLLKRNKVLPTKKLNYRKIKFTKVKKIKLTNCEIFIKKIKGKSILKKKIKKIKNNINIMKKTLSYKTKSKIISIKDSEQTFIFNLNFFKFIYNMKYWIFNLYFYFLSKLLLQESKTLFSKFFKKFELNVFEITRKAISADIVAKYIDSSFTTNHSVYETMRPILVDLEERIKTQKVAGFKITVSGRFKRAQRATYWWKKDAHLFTGTPTKGIDYAATIHRTKYGVCTISVWLTLGLKVSNGLKQEYPFLMPFFFLLKEDKLLNITYFLLKKNMFWLKKKGIKNNVILRKSFIYMLLYKYIYLYMFFKNTSFTRLNPIITTKFHLKRIYLPQYFVYKIFLEDILTKHNIKILPFIHLKFLKRINLRNSYKINFLSKITNMANINIYKYKIYLY